MLKEVPSRAMSAVLPLPVCRFEGDPATKIENSGRKSDPQLRGNIAWVIIPLRSARSAWAAKYQGFEDRLQVPS